MSGSIVRTLNWDLGNDQQFLAINPLGDEAVLYRTNHDGPSSDGSEIVKVNSRGGFDNIQCSAYSKVNAGLVGLGEINGSIRLFDIVSNESSMLNLRPKQSRPCNSLCFNDSGLIAAGFDKGRQDNSLQIWNIEHYSRTSTNDHIKRPNHSYIPNEAILSSVFYPDKYTNLLVGSHKFLREIDIRSETPAFQMSTRCTLGLSIDYFREYYFSSFSEDGSLSVWDRRKLYTSSARFKSSSSTNIISETPVLQFNKLLSDSSRKNRSPCVRQSSVRKGEFAALFNGDLVRRWNTGVVPPLHDKKYNKINSLVDPVTSSLKQQANQMYKPKEESLFVSFVLDCKTNNERIISFDYLPDLSSNTSANFICMRPSGSVFKMSVLEAVDCIAFNSRNEFTLSGPDGTISKSLDVEFQNSNRKFNQEIQIDHNRLIRTDIESTLDETESEDFSRKYPMNHHIDNKNFKNFKNLEEEEEEDIYGDHEAFIPLDSFLGLSEVLVGDICYTMRYRATLGYSTDCEKNVSVLESMDEKSTLINTWKWLSLAKKSLEKGTMISQGLDLGYQGVLGIWLGVNEFNTENRYKKEMGPINEKIFANAVSSIVSSKGRKGAAINISQKSQFEPQRKLSLIVSGWYLADNEFEAKLDQLVSLGMYEKAAGWAVFHGNIPKAIDILASSNKEKLRIISTAVAGYLAYKDSHVNSPWKDQCRKMASELDDPYLRAIFAFIADNDWWDVLDEHSLPLRERLGVALRFLSDKDLTLYLNRIAENVIAKGELEGLILTGITPKGIDLLQSYVDRTSDVQTAALISVFACPRYFSDQRVHHWISCFRDLLNSWNMFSIRAKFDVARTKLSKTYNGEATMQPRPKQVYLQCTRCNKNLSQPPNYNNGNRGVNTPLLMKQQFNKLSLKERKSDIKACPHCGAALPRCSICLLSLGVPIPDDKLTANSPQAAIENRFREWFSFCLSCNHGAHAFHAEEWFAKHYVCPVPNCNCRCNSK